MKDITLSIINALKADPSLVSFVGTRIYRGMKLPTGVTFPAITVSLVSMVPDPTVSLGRARIQVSCWGSSDGITRHVADTVEEAINRTSNTTLSGTFILLVRQLNETTIYEPTTDLFQVPVDLEVRYRYR